MSSHRQACTLKLQSALYCVTMIQAEINQYFNFKGDHEKHNLGKILKLKSAVVTLNIRSRSSKSSSTGSIQWFRRLAYRNPILNILKCQCDLEN